MAVDWDANVLQPLEDVFAEPVQYTSVDGIDIPGIVGVYDAAYREVDLTDPLANTTIVPVLGVRMALFVDHPPQQDDIVTVTSVNVTYVVREIRLDGHGWAKLMLGKMRQP